MFKKIDKSNRIDMVSFIHNKSIDRVNELFSIENCSSDIKSTLHFKELDELHMKNQIKLTIDINLDSNLQDLSFHTVKIISQDFLRNIKTFSYGYLLINRKTNKCFGFIY